MRSHGERRPRLTSGDRSSQSLRGSSNLVRIEGVRGSNPLSSTPAQRPSSGIGDGPFRSCTAVKYSGMSRGVQAVAEPFERVNGEGVQRQRAALCSGMSTGRMGFCGGADLGVPCPAADPRRDGRRSDSRREGRGDRRAAPPARRGAAAGGQAALHARRWMILAVLAKLLPRDRWKVFLVTPSTLLRWHRELIRRRWTYPATGRRRGLDPEVVELVLRLARDNARWGYLRIAGECRKLGVRPRRRCAPSCAGAGSARHPGAAVRAGPSSCAPRLPARWPVIS